MIYISVSIVIYGSYNGETKQCKLGTASLANSGQGSLAVITDDEPPENISDDVPGMIRHV